MKKKSGYIITLHMSTINQNHMMYDFWDTERDRQNFFLFWTVFFALLPFPSHFPLITQGIKQKNNPKKNS